MGVASHTLDLRPGEISAPVQGKDDNCGWTIGTGPPLFLGMPVIDADKAKTVIILKRSMASGFAGIANPLFFRPNSRMLVGEAKKTVSTVLAELKEGSG